MSKATQLKNKITETRTQVPNQLINEYRAVNDYREIKALMVKSECVTH